MNISLFFLFIIIFSINLVFLPSKIFAVTTVTSSYVGTVIKRSGVYDYAPSIIQDNNNYKMYWCSLASNAGGGDGIFYSQSKNTNRFRSTSLLFVVTPYSKETWGELHGHVCDPSVIKVNNIYYLYYTAANFSGVNNQIFLATSTDGINFTKYPSNSDPQPIIANIDLDNSYGYGQSTVFFHNNLFYMYYTDTHGGIVKTSLATSTNGINFNYIGDSFYINNFVPTYLTQFGKFFAVNAQDEGSPLGVYYAFSDDGLNWTTNNINQNYKLAVPQSRGSAHNIGILTNSLGIVTGNSTSIFYAAGGDNPPVWQPYSWDIDSQIIYIKESL